MKNKCEKNHWKCEDCNTRFPNKVLKCFVCNSDKIRFALIKNKKKKRVKSETISVSIKL